MAAADEEFDHLPMIMMMIVQFGMLLAEGTCKKYPSIPTPCAEKKRVFNPHKANPQPLVLSVSNRFHFRGAIICMYICIYTIPCEMKIHVLLIQGVYILTTHIIVIITIITIISIIIIHINNIPYNIA